MDSIPQRYSLVNQVAEALQGEIAKGNWREWLPNERALADELHVSRNTLRAAIAQLTARGVVQAVRPRGTRILCAGSHLPAKARTRTIGLLLPGPLDMMRPNLALIVDELRGQLAEIGYRLRSHHGEGYFAAGAAQALQRLVQQNDHECWVLALATKTLKTWFYANEVNCVVCGSCTPELPQPFVDLDYPALCRHAVGLMSAAGHRRVAFLIEKSEKTGDLDSERGFFEGLQQAARREVEGRVVHHQQTTASVIWMLERLFSSPKRPTALLVANPHFYLLAHSYLLSRGLRVPDDVSLICRDDDPFLAFVHPAPARYAFNAHALARRLFKLVMLVANGEVVARKDNRIMPDYQKGATFGPPRRA